jgi:hypothetical protein
MHCKRQIAKSSYHFSLANGNVERGIASVRSLGNFFLKFWTSISRGEMISFSSFFFMDRYWRWNCSSKKSSKNSYVFPWQTKMRTEVQCPRRRGSCVRADVGKFSWMFEPPYLEENDCLLKFFFFFFLMGRYWRWDCPLKTISKKPLTIFP